MNRSVFVAMSLCVSAELVAAEINDPVADFLRAHQSRASSRGDDRFYSDDKIYRLDLDLNGDGRLETLVSSSLDRDGKAGNVWAIYAASGDAVRNVGFATFNPDHFFVGKIEEIGQFGLVTFRPAGADEGIIVAYLFDGAKVAQIQLGSIDHERAAAGRALSDKYLSSTTTSSAPAPTVIGATDLHEKYGVQVQPGTYADALRETVASQSRAIPTASTQGPERNRATTMTSAASPSATADFEAAAKQEHHIWPWLIGIFAAVVFGFLVWKTRA